MRERGVDAYQLLLIPKDAMKAWDNRMSLDRPPELEETALVRIAIIRGTAVNQATREESRSCSEIELIFAGGGRAWQLLKWDLLGKHTERDMAVKWLPVIVKEIWADDERQERPSTPEVTELTRELLGASSESGKWKLCRHELRDILCLRPDAEVHSAYKWSQPPGQIY